jgi:actin-related protein 9
MRANQSLLSGGRIVNMEAFLAFLDHVHSMLTTTYHNTPIMLMASPQWTRPDCEAIARYIFEKTKTPALCLIHSGIATQYGLKWPHMTVVDIGFEKVDVTCIFESRVVSHKDVGAYDPFGDEKEISGGEVFTQKLISLLKDKEFNHEMAEQLKKSAICEVLPYDPEYPKLMDLPTEVAGVGSASQGKLAPAAPGSGADGPGILEPPRQPIDGDDDGANGELKGAEEDGVLDVANILASGQTREFLAKKEKEKAEKAKFGKRGKDKDGADAAAAKAVRLPNSKRVRNVFHFEEIVQEIVIPKPEAPAPAPAPAPEAAPSNGAKDVDMADAAAAATGDAPAAEGEAPKTETNGEAAAGGESEAPKPQEAEEPAAEPAPAVVEITDSVPERQTKRVRRDIEVGLERFLFADRAEIDRIVTAIYRAVQGIEDMYMRPACWENIVFVGNGARMRGLKENIMQTLAARHLISPSSATMFTSELPSNLATPSGTGSQTPTGSFTGIPHQLPTNSSVNPLLQAATTASLTASLGIPGGVGTPGPAGSTSGVDGSGAPTSHHFHSQTPTNIKLAQMPTYLSEWTKNGFEEAMFLGAQVAARLAFCIHNLDVQGLESQRLMSLGRVDYK